MRVFVTGATGFIGSALVQQLHATGHQVLGLARSDASAEALTRAGADVLRGDLSDAQSLTAGARAADGVIHMAFIHDFHAYAAAIDTDRKAISTLASALAGTAKALIVPSGTLLLPPGRLATEADSALLDRPIAARAVSEQTLLAAAARGVRACLVRLAPTVHGAGDKAFIPALIDVARRSGVAAYIDAGTNRWPAVHRTDAAHLMRLALEKAQPGMVLHAVAEEGVTQRAIADTIARALRIPTRSIPLAEAHAHFGWIALFSTQDNPTSSAETRAKLDWHPRGPGLLDDMRDNYFRG